MFRPCRSKGPALVASSFLRFRRRRIEHAPTGLECLTDGEAKRRATMDLVVSPRPPSGIRTSDGPDAEPARSSDPSCPRAPTDPAGSEKKEGHTHTHPRVAANACRRNEHAAPLPCGARTASDEDPAIASLRQDGSDDDVDDFESSKGSRRAASGSRGLHPPCMNED